MSDTPAMNKVMACIDGSSAASAVCDCAAWASLRMGAPLELLHVLDHERYPTAHDFSGAIGLGSREHLLDELVQLDERRAKLALEQGRLMLEAARERAVADGVAQPALRQRHGDLVESLLALTNEIRLLVIGRSGALSDTKYQAIGSHLESVIRTVPRPILVATGQFTPPQRFMIAFDGSATSRKCVEMVAGSPLLRDLPVHVVSVGSDNDETRAQLAWAQTVLAQAGFDVTAAIRSGEIEPTLHNYQREQQLDLLVMGAYGHSRIREFLVGSTTTKMLRTTESPLLLLR
jgi:nucleotide-binding universal stress UspA family protein